MIARHFASPLLYDERAPDGASGHCNILTGSAAGRGTINIIALLARRANQLTGVGFGRSRSGPPFVDTTAVHCDTAIELKARILYQDFLATISPLSL